MHVALLGREKLGDLLLLVPDSQMLLNAVQPRGVGCQHALEEIESFDKLFEDLIRRKVFSHLLS
jgi:hypothetical protein